MNILVMTPMYFLDRPELVQDTAAIHYLLKYIAKDNDVRVIFTYLQSPRHLLRYLNKRQFQYMKNGYYYEADGVKIAMCEITLKKDQTWVLEGIQAKRVAGFTRNYLANENFTPDVVVTHVPMSSVNVWKYLNLNVPKFAVLHTSDIKLAKLFPDLLPELRGSYDHFFARSKPIIDYFQNTLDVDENIIYSGVDVPERVYERMEKDEGEAATVLYVGKLTERKRLDYLLRAVSILKDRYQIRLEIYGDGKCRHEFEKLASKLLASGTYEFYGNKSRTEIFNAMSHADIFCMPSVNETLGLVYLEAMSCGCITIGSRGEGIDGVIEDGINGFLVNPDDVNDIASKISDILQMSPEEKKAFRERTMETMGQYSEESASRNYLKRIEECLAG